MTGLDDAQRLERHVDRTGEHHLWTGSTSPLRGTGRLQVNSKQTAAKRRGWGLGPANLSCREVPLDNGTLEVLHRHPEDTSARAAFLGIPAPDDPFLFSLEPDGSRPMLPGYVAKRLQVLKGHLGVEDKRPETVALKDEALRLRRYGVATRSVQRGPAPTNGAALSYDEVGRILERSQMWARHACDAADRRESVGADRQFNLSFNGFRKFTSSELLDAGFNLNVVAQRQGHSPAVLTKHYSKARLSARRKAAEHLGAWVTNC